MVNVSPKLLVHYTAKPMSNATMAVADQFGALGILALGASMAAQTSKHSGQLRKTVGDFNERGGALLNDLRKHYDSSNMTVQMEISGDTELKRKYFRSNGLPGRRPRKEESPYTHLIYVDETAGMRTGTDMGTLSASSWIEYNVFDAATLKSMAKGNLSALADTTYGYDTAVLSPDPLKTDYPSVSDLISKNLIQTLSGLDVLSRMDKSISGQ